MKGVTEFYHKEIHNPSMHQDIFGDEYIGQLDFWSSIEIREFGEMLILKEDSNLLDIGSGLGGPACYLAKLFGCNVVGVEITEGNQLESITRSELLGVQNRTNFICGDIMNQNFESDTFDSIMLIDSLVHIPNRGDLFAFCNKWLNKGGRLLVACEALIDPNTPRHLIERRNALGFVFTESIEGYKKAFIESGFRVIKEEVYDNKRSNFSRKAIEWMDKNNQTKGRENMELIGMLCEGNYAKEVMFLLEKE